MIHYYLWLNTNQSSAWVDYLPGIIIRMCIWTKSKDDSHDYKEKHFNRHGILYRGVYLTGTG